MKESKLIEMQNRIANLEAILKQLIPEINGIKDLAFGTFIRINARHVKSAVLSTT